MFYAIAVFDLIRRYVPKVYYTINYKSNWSVNLIFEICLDSKFPVRGQILKKMLTIIRNSIDYFESFNKFLILRGASGAEQLTQLC